jgi:anti-anti-sigma regulatory factor
MYELKISQQDKSAKLILTGALTLPNALAIKEAFTNLLKQGNNLVVNHEGADEFDISFLQLLVALNKSVYEANKKLLVEGPFPESFVTLITGKPLLHWEKNESANDVGGTK